MTKCHQLRASATLFRRPEKKKFAWPELKLNFSPLPFGEEQNSMCLKNMTESVKTKAEIILSWVLKSGRKPSVPSPPPIFTTIPEW